MKNVHTLIEKLPPRLRIGAPFLQQPRDQPAAPMPRREIRQVGFDHAVGIRKLGLDHAAPVERRALQLVNDVPAVPPRVKVAPVAAEHHRYEPEFFFPYFAGLRGGEPGYGLFEDPEPVAPDPVAFGRLEEQWDGEC